VWQEFLQFFLRHASEIVIGTVGSIMASGILAILTLLRRRRRTVGAAISGGANRVDLLRTLAVVRDIYRRRSGWEWPEPGKEHVIVAGIYLMTNITVMPIILTKVEAIVNGRSEGAALIRQTEGDMLRVPQDALLPNVTAEFGICFFVKRNEITHGQDLVLDLRFVDQLGNENWMRSEHFRMVESLA
jgi:hypothetical protein